MSLINVLKYAQNNIYVFIPLLAGMVVGRLCPMGDGPKTRSQPPGWVFGVVWPVLFVLIGMNWNRTKNNPTLNILHWLMIAALNYWVYIVGCKDNWKQGGWTFVPIVGVSLATWILSASRGSPLLLVPYLAWILFAQQLNVHIVESSS